MTNRDRLLNMSLYDLLMEMKDKGVCVLRAFGTTNRERCLSEKSCEKCVAKWLNEEEGARNG